MADQRVRETRMDWATQVAIARANQLIDSGQAAPLAVEQAMQPVVYEFSGGRTFRDSGRKPRDDA